MGERGPGFAPTQIGVLLEWCPTYVGVHWEGSKPFDQNPKLGHASLIKLFLGVPIYDNIYWCLALLHQYGYIPTLKEGDQCGQLTRCEHLWIFLKLVDDNL